MSEPIKRMINSWNEAVHDFEIKLSDLCNPKPMFFVEVILKIFELMDIQFDFLFGGMSVDGDSIYRHHYSLIQLTEATNRILTEMSPDCQTITIYDFINPTPSKVQTVLMCLTNFIVLFIGERKGIILEREKEIKTFHDDMNDFKEKIENINERIYNLNMTNDKEYLKQTEVDIIEFKAQNDELEKRVNELKTNFDLFQEEKEHLQSKCANKRLTQAPLLEKVNRLKSHRISDEEKVSILKSKEAAIQRNKEMSEKLEDVKTTLMKKTEDIKTFKSDSQAFKKGEELLMDLMDLYKKIEDAEKFGETSYDEEKKLRDLKDVIYTNEKNALNLTQLGEQYDEDITKMTTSLQNKEREFESVKIEIDELNLSIEEMKNNVEKSKKSTETYHGDYKCIVEKQEDISNVHNKQIEECVNRIKNMVEEVVVSRKKFEEF